MQNKYKLIAICILMSMTFNCNKLVASDSIQKTGDIIQFVLPGAATTLVICHKDWDGAIEFSESFALTLGVTYALKYTINEQRPNGGSHSFPSGHTSSSFSSAEFIWERYGWEYGLPAFALAAFVGYSRVESHEHYTHDVIAGAAIGILSSYIFTKPYKGWQVSVEGDTKTIGMQFSRSF